MFAELGHVLGKAADRVLAYPCIVLAEVVGPRLAARDYMRRGRFAADALAAAEAEYEVLEPAVCGEAHPLLKGYRCVREPHGPNNHRCEGALWTSPVDPFEAWKCRVHGGVGPCAQCLADEPVPAGRDCCCDDLKVVQPCGPCRCGDHADCAVRAAASPAAGERTPDQRPAAGCPWTCVHCGNESNSEVASQARLKSGVTKGPFCSAKCADMYVIATEGFEALPAMECCGHLIGHAWFCPTQAARRGTGVTGTWRFTPEELELLGLTPGDQLGRGVIGPPVSSGLTVFREYDPTP